MVTLNGGRIFQFQGALYARCSAVGRALAARNIREAERLIHEGDRALKLARAAGEIRADRDRAEETLAGRAMERGNTWRWGVR